MAKPANEIEALGEALRSIVLGSGSLAKKISGDTQIEYHERGDRHILLPNKDKPMGLEEAAARLTALAAFKAQVFSIHEQLDGLPLDAAHAFVQILRRRYGWAETKSATKEGWFGPIKTKPEMHRVRTGTGPRDFVEVPIGDFELPDISTKIRTGFEGSSKNRRMAAYFVQAEVKHDDRDLIMQLISEAQEYLATNSIYRGKGMRLRVDENGEIGQMFEPEFVDYTTVDETSLIHPRDTERLLETGLFTPIRKVETCRQHGVPLKRTVLFTGDYGCGKTLTSAVTAKIGLAHGWTFITVDNASGLTAALEFAKRYQPAIVFAEDIDRVMEERDEKANDLLNTINGILSSNSEVITVLTTNHLEKIHQAMLRPGRIDLVIPIGRPDAETAERLMRNYSRGLISESMDLSRTSEIVAGFIPAMIREVVESAKLAMITDGRQKLSQEDLETAAIGKKVHAELLAPKSPVVSPEEEAGKAIKRLLNGHDELLNGIANDCHRLVEMHE